jgi:TrmH family RNA methyltransferase
MTPITSRDNERVKRWAKLVRDGRFRRTEGRAILEGPHLIAAFIEQGYTPVALFATEQGLMDAEIKSLVRKVDAETLVLAENVFSSVVDTETPQGIAAEIAVTGTQEALDKPSVFIEAVQDAGNVGAIIRSAAAFGIGNVILDRACADPWSPKVLRAGMGGHFSLSIRQVADLGKEVLSFKGRTLCASTRGGAPLVEADLSGRIGWVLGSEGRGLSPGLQEKAEGAVTIPLAPNAESLNVAAAAAICFYEAFCRSSRPGAGS